MEFLRDIEDKMAKPGWLSRQTFIKRAAKASAALAALVAGMRLDNAYASNVYCCTLLYPNNTCNSNYMQGQCPCPTTPYQWTCYSGGCKIVCGECYACKCSYAYFPCQPGCPCRHDAPSIDTMNLLLPHRAAGEACH